MGCHDPDTILSFFVGTHLMGPAHVAVRGHRRGVASHECRFTGGAVPCSCQVASSLAPYAWPAAWRPTHGQQPGALRVASSLAPYAWPAAWRPTRGQQPGALRVASSLVPYAWPAAWRPTRGQQPGALR
eukprot:361431-Chlamydomonas_euryale.AAC.7